MDEDRYQKELFEFDEPKKPFSKLSTMLPKPDLDGKVAVVLTLDKMVFIAMGIVMIMVLVFALGVEMGKARIRPRPTAVTAPPELAPRPAVVPAATKAQAAQTVPIVPAVAQGNITPSQKTFFNTSPAVAAPQTAAATAADQGISKPFTIVAAAFNKRDTAQAGAEILKRDGFPAYVYYSSPYYLVCTGGYDDKNGSQVQRDLKAIKRTYKDAYIKQR